ncbi:MAG: N-formylglutamate amidohydrolase [Alphaproteobacteria bacterium]
MSTELASDAPIEAYDIAWPARVTAPVVYASPHSGTYYPTDFIAASALDFPVLRRSEDSFVDELFAAAPGFGSPLLRCRYARVYLDVNREPYELDPNMFEDELPPHTNTTSLRVAGGLGTIARMVADGAEVYRSKLQFKDAEHRVQQVYQPYHQALGELLTRARDAFGVAVLIDCHSMPSTGVGRDAARGRSRPDVVLGDRFGTACSPALIDRVQRLFAAAGYAVTRNTPYAGGFTTHHYGRPGQNVHALQIEINRGIYMDEERLRPLSGFGAVQAQITQIMAALSGLTPDELGDG